MKFLIDADLPDSAVEPFREEGLEADHVRDLGMGSAADEDIVSYAEENGYIIVTRDQHFGSPLLHPLEEHNGVIILKLPNQYRVGGIKKRLQRFLQRADLEEVSDAVVIVEEARYRVRVPGRG